MSKIKELGTPTTVGELKEIINNYPKSTSFGFRNQPIQSLYEVKVGSEDFIFFQEAESEFLEKKAKMNLKSNI